VTVFKHKGLWGSLSKTNTAVLGYRPPIHKTFRELALSYFPLYVNTKGQFCLVEFAAPINLNSLKFKKWDWRNGDDNYEDMGISFNKLPHQQLISRREIIKLKKVPKKVIKAAFYGAIKSALYSA
jgi:hypothetical protein